MSFAAETTDNNTALPERGPGESSVSAARTADVGAGLTPLVPNLLVVDDDPSIRSQLERLYSQNGYAVVAVPAAEAAIAHLAREITDFVITDIKLPEMSGVELITHIHEKYPDVPVIAITAYSDIETAVTVLKHGASDFVVKPFDLAAVLQSSRAALEKTRVCVEIRHLRRSLKDNAALGGMLSKTPEMHRVFEMIRMVAPTDMTVLVEGETGTGKELVAGAIHNYGRRNKGPFVTINCAGFPESLLESELFGYERGAFTGADQPRAGKIELAHGGTLFLDEIESMSVLMQSKLLRVLEEQKVQRLGGSKSTRVDMRVIAATNIPLKEMLSQGKMRLDFYYRINVVPIQLIPLRQRKMDIPLLIHDFLHHHPVAAARGISGVSKTVMSRLMDYSWPGNVRELQNMLERALVLTNGRVIESVEVSSDIPETRKRDLEMASSASLKQWLQGQEKHYLAQKLDAFDGNIGLTAKFCGIGVRSLSRKMRLHGLERKYFAQKG